MTHLDIEEKLAAARESLSLGIKLSNQGSYARRAPDQLSLPHFNEASRLLNEVLKKSSNNLEALIMISHVSECILDFDSAAIYQCKAFEAGEPKSKRSLKRLALLRASTNAWHDLSLTPESLSQLGRYLEEKGVGPDDRTLRLTRE